ncbi:MAG: reverse transcriptase domain-containing protein [Pelagibacteraceae bacterium]
MDQPSNTRSDYDELKGIQVWNGIPYHDFTLIWFAALMSALGAIVQDGYTLLQTARGEDDLGDVNNPAEEARRRHLSRRARLASCILRYINPKSGVFRFLRHTCPDDGVRIYRYLRTYGHLDYTDAQREALLRDWDRATMMNVGIKIDEEALFKWVEWIRMMSAKLNKSPRQERRKFLYGLPIGFNDAVMAEKMNEPDGNYVYPDFWPAHHPEAGQAVPGHLADHPDIWAAACAFYDEWCSRIRRGMLKPLPRHSAHRLTHDEPESDASDNETACLTCENEPHDSDRDDFDSELVYKFKHSDRMHKITPNVVCAACGGRGHFAKVGSRKCLTVELNTRPPVEELKATRYPNGISYPAELGSKPSSSRHSAQLTKLSRRPRPKSPHQSSKLKPKRPESKPKVRVIEAEPEVEAAVQESSSEDEMVNYVGLAMELGDIDCHPGEAARMVYVKSPSGTRSENGKKPHFPRFILDSGATIHCINDPSLFESVDEDHDPLRITVANNSVVHSKQMGTVLIDLKDKNGKSHTHRLSNVVYHPDFSDNLLSVRRLWDDHSISSKFGSSCELHDHSKACTYVVPLSNSRHYTVQVFRVKIEPSDANLLHSRLGHCSLRRLKAAASTSDGLPSCHFPSDDGVFADCDACCAGGSKRKSLPPVNKHVFTYFGERLSSDLCLFPEGIGGYTYLLNIVDAYTRYCVCYPLRSKLADVVRECFLAFLDAFRYHLPSDQIVTWHTDNGGEFISNDLDEFCREFCIHRSFTVPYTPHQNGLAERLWGILLRTVRIVMHASRLPIRFWVYAAQHACMLHNMLPSRAFQLASSPYEKLFGKKPNLSKIRVWGCLAWYHLEPKDIESKLAPRSVPAVHLGLDPKRHGYIVLVPSLKRITTAVNLKFNESKFVKLDDNNGIVDVPGDGALVDFPNEVYKETRDDTHVDHVDKPMASQPSDELVLDDADEFDPKSIADRPTRSEQVEKGKNPPRKTRNNAPLYALYADDVSPSVLLATPDHLLSNVVEPKSYREAVSGRYAERWKAAMLEEVKTLQEHGTWVVVERSKVPKDRKVTKSKWVFKVKVKRDGSIERFKARFVVCGYSQVLGQDYTQSFSATLRCTSLRVILAIASGKKLWLAHFDVKNAFTQSDIDHIIFVEPPAGFEQKGKDGLIMVLQLVKSLYGTKQASRLWQEKLRHHLTENMGFVMSQADPCLFVRGDADSENYMILGVYVDDIVVAYRKKTDLDWFNTNFTGPKGFNASHLGKLSWFLGAAIDQFDDYSISINQDQYLSKLVDKFVASSKLVKHTPYPCKPLAFPRLAPATTDSERDRAAKLPYLQLIGSLLYLSCLTRPDVSYHMSVLCGCMHDPTVAAYEAAVELLLYLHTTNNGHLHFSGNINPPANLPPKIAEQIQNSHGLVAFSDASWHKPDKLGYNKFGYIIFLYGGVISYASKNIKVVALSSAEAEYAAAAYTCKEIVFVRNILSDLKLNVKYSTVLCVDNQAAIKIAENIGVTARNKHFEDSIHYFRHQVDHHVILPVYVTTKNQRADGFTKALDNKLFKIWSATVCNFEV